jgi:D-alanyl-D-alanine carboxypeptidase (penicillin-binding protein 5/6)
MDTIRNGAFGLTNTNRLIRFYKGATGLKTGSTEKAGFCVSATAERDGLSLICVIMGAQTRDLRNAQASRLLDWGFANFASYSLATPKLPQLSVVGGESAVCPLSAKSYTTTLPKAALSSIQTKTVLPESVAAPIHQGDTLGEIHIMQGDELLGSVPIIAATDIPRVSYLSLLKRLFSMILLQ